MDTCSLLVRPSTLIGGGKDWLAQCQDSVIEWDIISGGYSIRQHYNVTMSAQLTNDLRLCQDGNLRQPTKYQIG